MNNLTEMLRRSVIVEANARVVSRVEQAEADYKLFCRTIQENEWRPRFKHRIARKEFIENGKDM